MRLEVEPVANLFVLDQVHVVHLRLPLPQEQRMQVAVIFDEGVLDLVVEPLLGFELFGVEKVDDIVGGQKDVYGPYAEAQDGEPGGPALAQLHVEEDLPRASQDEGDLDELHAVD